MKILSFVLLFFFNGNLYSQRIFNLETLSELPNKTEIAIGIYSGDSTITFGYRLVNDEFVRINNSSKLFEIGSISKVFTSCLALKIFSERSLSIKSKLDKFVPISNVSEISVENLLTHTSGFPKMPSNFIWSALRCPSNPFLHYCEKRMIKYFENRDIIRNPPNEKYVYSNLGFGLLGYILESIEKEELHNLYSREIFSSMEMGNTSLGITKKQYEQVPKKNGINGKLKRTWEFTNAMSAAGAIYSNIEDMLNFMGTVINKDSNDDQLNMVLEEMENERFEINRNEQIGLGWKIITKDNSEILYHGGITSGFKSLIAVEVIGEQGIVVLTNANGLSRRENEILKQFCFNYLTQ